MNNYVVSVLILLTPPLSLCIWTRTFCFLLGLNYDDTSREWDGMVRELLEQRADLAIADLTITFDREQVFTFPSSDSVLALFYIPVPAH